MRRNNLDIYSDILKIANCGAKKTQIVYKCNLNFKILDKYLTKLKEKKLLEKKGRIYYTTPKGIDFVTQYEKLFAPLSESIEVSTL